MRSLTFIVGREITWGLKNHSQQYDKSHKTSHLLSLQNLAIFYSLTIIGSFIEMNQLTCFETFDEAPNV